jgi:hypothetical protein
MRAIRLFKTERLDGSEYKNYRQKSLNKYVAEKQGKEADLSGYDY